MKKNSIWNALILLVGLGVCFLLIASHGPSEPAFEGKSLSFWLRQYGSTMLADSIPRRAPNMAARNNQAVAAVRAIGTNAIPFLLRMLRAKDSAVCLQVLRLARTLHIKVPYRPAYERNRDGRDGFAILGDAARDAVPALAEIFEENISTPSQQATGTALWHLGASASAARPTLLRSTTNSDSGVRLSALSALDRQLDSSPADVLPALLRALNDPSYVVQSMAIKIIGGSGVQATGAVPTLARLATNGDVRLRRSACGALGRISAVPEEAIPALVLGLEDPDAGVRKASAWSLGEFREQAKSAVPRLTALQQDEDAGVRKAAGDALGKITAALGPPASPR